MRPTCTISQGVPNSPENPAGTGGSRETKTRNAPSPKVRRKRVTPYLPYLMRYAAATPARVIGATAWGAPHPAGGTHLSRRAGGPPLAGGHTPQPDLHGGSADARRSDQRRQKDHTERYLRATQAIFLATRAALPRRRHHTARSRSIDGKCARPPMPKSRAFSRRQNSHLRPAQRRWPPPRRHENARQFAQSDLQAYVVPMASASPRARKWRQIPLSCRPVVLTKASGSALGAANRSKLRLLTLDGLDQRTRGARTAAHMVEAFKRALGARYSPALKPMVEAAAMAAAIAADLQARMLAGDTTVTINDCVRAVNTARCARRDLALPGRAGQAAGEVASRRSRRDRRRDGARRRPGRVKR